MLDVGPSAPGGRDDALPAMPPAPEAYALVAEDDPALNTLLCRIIDRTGHAAQGVRTGEEAAAAISSPSPPWLVVLDYSLPDMTADDLLDRIPRGLAGPAVVIVTGRGNEQTAIDLMKRGCRDYLIKDGKLIDRLPISIRQIEADLQLRRSLARAQTDLARREERFRSLYDQAPVPSVSLDGEGRIQSVNRAWLDLLGYSRDEALGKPMNAFLETESALGLMAALDAISRDGVAARPELAMRRKDGSSIWVECSGRAGSDDSGDVREYHLALRDLTAQRRAERVADERRTAYQEIVETADEGIWVMDADLRATFVNRRLADMLGYSVDEMLGRNIEEFMPDDELADHRRKAADRAMGRTDRYVRHLKRRDGSTCAVLVSATPRMGPDGKFVGSFAMMTDISDLERAERDRAEASLKLSGFFRAAPAGMGIVVDRIFVETNERISEMTGYSRDEMLGRSARMLYPSQEDFEYVGREKYRRMAEGGVGSVQTRWQRKDGVLIDVLLSSTPVDPDDPARGVLFTATDISESVQAHRDVKAANDLLQRTFDAAPDMISLHGLDHTIHGANRALAERLGMGIDELIGRKCCDVIHRCVEPPDACPLCRVLTEGGTCSVDMAEPWLGGTFAITASPLHDAEGNLTGVVHVMRDITERAASERKARSSRDYLDRIINAIADPIFVKDESHRWVLVNNAECELTGRSRDELLYRTDHDYFPSEQADLFRQNDEAVLKTGETNISEETLTDAAGRRRILVTTKTRYVDADGNAFVVGVSRDITELREAAESLERSRARIASLYDLAMREFETEEDLIRFALEEVVRLTGSEYGYIHFMDADQVNLNLFAWSASVLKVCTASTERKYSLADAGVWADCARLKRPVIHNDYPNLPERRGLPEGHVPIGRHISVPVLDGDTVQLIAGVANKAAPYDETDAHDLGLYVTDLWHMLMRRRAESELRAVNADLDRRVRLRTAQLEAANRELDAFAYSVSHDITAPLRAMDGFTQLLLDEHADRLSDEGRNHLARVRGSVRQMERLVEGLLRLSRATRRPLNRQPVDLSAIAAEIADTLRETDPHRDVQFDIAPGVLIEGDQDLVRILLENLLRNSWKFTGKHRSARIEFGAERRGEQYVCFVRDDGAGFDMSQADKLFGAFQRLHEADEFEGSGIGLAIVQRIVAKHGGTIWAEGETEHGATFWFTLGTGVDGAAQQEVATAVPSPA